jgi:uncharacterized protein (TIGR03435 family)
MKRERILSGVLVAATAFVVLPMSIACASAPAQSSVQDQPIAGNPDDAKFASFVYDVVSIKPYKDEPNATVRWMGSKESPDGLTLHNAPLTQLIALAYRTEHSKVTGAPDWMNKERYDMEAKMEPEVADALQKLSPEDQKLARQHMLRVLTRDYLKLAFHMETAQVPIYELVIGKNGPKLKTPADPNSPEQGLRVSGSGVTTMWDGKSTKLSSMMGQLAYVMGRPVYDKTGLKENYDFTLKYTPDRPASAGPGADNPAPPDEAPPITIAIEEQLGLKLVSTKGPMDSIVIDHVEKPGAN